MEYNNLLNKLSTKLSEVKQNAKDKKVKTSMDVSAFDEVDTISTMLNKIELEIQRQGGH